VEIRKIWMARQTTLIEERIAAVSNGSKSFYACSYNLPFSAYIYREKRKSTLKKKNSLNVYAPIHNITPDDC